MADIKNGNWPQERIREKLAQLHEQENEWNREFNKRFYIKSEAEKRMSKLRKWISKNHKYRHLLTTYLLPPEPTKKNVENNTQ